MNRNQRRLGRAPKRNVCEREKVIKSNGTEIEEERIGRKVPKSHRGTAKIDFNIMRDRCCFISPDQQEFGHSNVLFENTFKERHVLESKEVPYTVNLLKDLKKMLCPEFKVENSSQYESRTDSERPEIKAYAGPSSESSWQNIDNANDIDSYLKQGRRKQDIDEIPQRGPQNVRISDSPRVKVIAEKYSRYKRNNIEVRKLEEKVVCVEYDVYDLSIFDMAKPVQTMRAFFTIKPVCTGEDGREISATKLPSDIKLKYNVADEDLKKLSNKELEIIDGKIKENKPYLDDLKKILKRNQVINDKKNKTTLDLMSLYEIARREQFILDSNISKANILSKAELQEMKDLILRRCMSNMNGTRRTKVGRGKETDDTKTLSNSIIAELTKQEFY